MDIKVVKVKQYNSTYKHIVMVNGDPVVITQSTKRAAQCVAYLSDKNVEIGDGTVRKLLDKIKEGGLDETINI